MFFGEGGISIQRLHSGLRVLRSDLVCEECESLSLKFLCFLFRSAEAGVCREWMYFLSGERQLRRGERMVANRGWVATPSWSQGGQKASSASPWAPGPARDVFQLFEGDFCLTSTNQRVPFWFPMVRVKHVRRAGNQPPNGIIIFCCPAMPVSYDSVEHVCFGHGVVFLFTVRTVLGTVIKERQVSEKVYHRGLGGGGTEPNSHVLSPE